ncbi:hypothetical protein GTW56_09165 [Bacillus sp. EB93]|nr:hypothetical protein [Peribacillus frigoritolerans]
MTRKVGFKKKIVPSIDFTIRWGENIIAGAVYHQEIEVEGAEMTDFRSLHVYLFLFQVFLALLC